MKRWLILICLAVAMAGCTRPVGSLVAEQEETAFRRGKQKLREGRPDEALQAFMSVVEKRNDAPESHLECGLLYLNRFNDPILAIYHFNEYLHQKPNSEQAERVRQLIITAKKEFARSLPASPFGDDVDKLDLKELLDKTREENTALKTELQKAREELEHYKTAEETRRAVLAQGAPVATANAAAAAVKAAPSPASAAGAKATASGSKPKVYAVQDGDTLSIIAKKFLGSSAKWKEIYEANKGTMKSATALKIGQQLIIP